MKRLNEEGKAIDMEYMDFAFDMVPNIRLGKDGSERSLSNHSTLAVSCGTGSRNNLYKIS